MPLRPTRARVMRLEVCIVRRLQRMSDAREKRTKAGRLVDESLADENGRGTMGYRPDFIACCRQADRASILAMQRFCQVPVPAAAKAHHSRAARVYGFVKWVLYRHCWPFSSYYNGISGPTLGEVGRGMQCCIDDEQYRVVSSGNCPSQKGLFLHRHQAMSAPALSCPQSTST
jgi:hypothetical protein